MLDRRVVRAPACPIGICNLRQHVRQALWAWPNGSPANACELPLKRSVQGICVGVLPLKNTTFQLFGGNMGYICIRLTSPGLGVLRGRSGIGSRTSKQGDIGNPSIYVAFGFQPGTCTGKWIRRVEGKSPSQFCVHVSELSVGCFWCRQ